MSLLAAVLIAVGLLAASVRVFAMSQVPADQHLRELLAHAHGSKVSLARALELARPQFAKGRIVKAQPREHGGQRTLDFLFLIEVETEKGLMLAPKEVRIDVLTAAVKADDPETIDEEDARAIVAGFPNFGRDLHSFEEALSTGEREVQGGVPVDVRLGGQGDRPEILLTVATGEDALTLRLDASSGQILSRAAWRESLREAAETVRHLELLGSQFDPACAEFYADEARIHNERRMPDGRLRKMEMTGGEYKKLFEAALPLARARGDRSTLRDMVFRMEGCAVRVRATRFSELKKYESPIDWLFAKDEHGRCRDRRGELGQSTLTRASRRRPCPVSGGKCGSRA